MSFVSCASWFLLSSELRLERGRPGVRIPISQWAFFPKKKKEKKKNKKPLQQLPCARRLSLQGPRCYWLDRIQYTVIGRERKFDVQLLSQCGSTYNCLSRSSTTSSRTVPSGGNRDTSHGRRMSQPPTSCRERRKTCAAPSNSWQHVD